MCDPDPLVLQLTSPTTMDRWWGFGVSRSSGVTVGAYLPQDLVSNVDAVMDRACASILASTLESLSQVGDAAGRGVQAFLLSWRVAHRDRLQWRDGRGYVETCPAYLATVDGVTRWAAARGWAVLQDVVGWVESSVAEVVSLGVRLRTLPRGTRRGGRHLLLDPWMVSALDRASGWTSRPRSGSVRVSVTPRVVETLESRQVRTVAVSCPHHRDQDPSLVLWSNGGAMCLSCGWRAAWTLEGDSIHLHPSSGTPPRSRPHRVRYNIRPPQGDRTRERTRERTRTPGGDPVGGCVATRSRTRTVVGVSLTEYQDREGRWNRSRSKGHQLRGDLLEVLERAEVRSRGERCRESAQWASWSCGPDLPGRAVLPDLLVSTSSMGRPSWRDRWEPRVQRWVLVDLDGVGDLDRTGESLVSSLAEVVSQDVETSGRMAVVRTSSTGLQVWVELAAPRHSPRRWCSTPEVRDWFQELGESLLDVVHQEGARGGHLDTSSLGAGRYGRRPGWRWKGGEPYRAHLLGVVRGV